MQSISSCLNKPNTVAISHCHDRWFWCLQNKHQKHAIHSAGTLEQTETHLPWPASSRIHWVLQPQQLCHGKTVAAHTQEKPYLAAKAKLAACEQLGCDSKQLLFDYHMVSAYQLHWYAIKAQHLQRAQRLLTERHHLHVIEPCTHAMMRALRQLLPNTHDQPIMALQWQQHTLYITRWHCKPWQCTMHQAMTYTQAKRYIMALDDQTPWLWIDSPNPMPEHKNTAKPPAKAWQALRAALPEHQALKLPTLASVCRQPCLEAWHDSSMGPWLALYGSMLRKTAHGH